MGDLREPNGVVSEDSLVPPSSSTSSCFGPEVWARPEEATQKIIRQVQPTVASEERRRDVIDYVQRLLKAYLGCEVFPFGSVPLRTYLPDGDIDLTAFCAFSFEEGFANDVYSVLEAEDRNPLAEFVVKDVQYIRAEVKLVKCLVQNIVVDLSFNQIGGLCALCFLEEVDRLIAKDHLFKRSIILIKAWCYYESRILGAHHGLISTYALETLVLYIFHLFHSSLNGPLAVLFKFLDYFSKFDWDNYCVSLSGPVPVSSLPEILADKPENGGDDLLLSDDFIRECVNKFSVPSRGTDTRMFVQKHLNIVDPLKENNNLGRSVSKGNFFRIRSALSFGARKLGQILLQPQENVAEEVRRFFTNTLERHGQGRRPDVQDLPGCNGFVPEILVPNYQEDNNNYGHEEESLNSSDQSIEFTNVRDDPSASPSRLSGDARDLASSGVRDLRITTQSSDKLLGNAPPYTPHLYLPHSLNNGKIENGDLDEVHHQPTQGNRDFPTFTGTNLVNSDTQKILPDLSGEIECHLESLRYGRWWYEHVPNMPVRQLHMPPPPPPLFQRKNTWDPIRQPSLHFRQDMVPHMSVNGVHPFFPMNPQVVPGAAFAVDEMPKTRGTGTYFPITNHNSYRDRYSQGKGRPHGQLRSPRANGRTQTPLDRSPQPQSPVRQGSGKLSSPRGKAFTSEKPEEAALAERDSNKAQDSSAISENGENPMVVLNYDR